MPKTLVILTKDAPENLQNCAASFLNHARQFDEQVQILIIDDSRTRTRQLENRSIAKEIVKKFNTVCKYIDRNDRMRIANKISRKFEIPLSILKFGLLGNSNVQMSVGSARNTALLLTAGKKFISVDDDIRCELIQNKNTNSFDPKLEKQPSLEHWFNPNELRSSSVNFYEIHHRFLGSDIQTFLKLSDTSARHVTLSTMGHHGDSGMEQSTIFFHMSRSSREKIMKSKESYLANSQLHDFGYFGTQLTVAPVLGCQTGNIGIDNRQWTPPFFPNFKNEDGFFGKLLGLINPLAHISYLPLAIHHQQKTQRPAISFNQNSSLRTLDFFIFSMKEIERYLTKDPILNLRCIVDFFLALSNQDSNYLKDLILSLNKGTHWARIDYLKKEFPREARPVFLESDYQTYLNHLVKSFHNPSSNLPEFSQQSSRNNMSLLKQMLKQYALLLEFWPRLHYEAAQGLADGLISQP